MSEAQKLRAELYLAILIQSVTGCRVSEILNRQTSDIRLEEGAVVFEIPARVRVRAKPNHPPVLSPSIPRLPRCCWHTVMRL